MELFADLWQFVCDWQTEGLVQSWLKVITKTVLEPAGCPSTRINLQNADKYDSISGWVLSVQWFRFLSYFHCSVTE